MTTLNSRTDLDYIEGNSIILYLPERSTVEAYKGDALIHIESYYAGNQEINTKDFPYGSYNVRFRIKSASGSEKEETRFLHKNGSYTAPWTSHVLR